MTPLDLAWNAVQAVLRPLGYELRARDARAHRFTMAAALRRAAGWAPDIRTVVDVGAASGRWTRLALPHFPAARCLLLEPLEEQRAALEELHAAQPRVEFLIAAAGERAGETAFTVAPDLDGSGIYDAPAAGKARPVAVTTLDAEIARLGLQPPFFLKLDTHGYEAPILAGAAGMLAECAVIVVEAYNFRLSQPCLRFHELCAHLETLGFRCVDLADPLERPRDGALWQLDLFFLRKTHPLVASDAYA